jgi:hypothetical protein
MLVSDYLNYREKHFSVIKTQFSQLIIKIIITASLLSMEVPSTVPTNEYRTICCCRNHYFISNQSVEKNRIGLETLYDVLTSVEK